MMWMSIEPFPLVWLAVKTSACSGPPVEEMKGHGGSSREPVIRWVVRKFGPDVPTPPFDPVEPLTRIVYPS
ncbi:hypothetical protein MES5069_480022 [Mesorhizobium escarrei]|uniref:Secreted protein n=1 Tax=Mesorhizobium escarrei TaxID=666018 RepID=A0ABM9E8Y3_9HYPH|nr:hypothetical protein MES5069_480022 [Mesorhizobium escarrei]